LDCMRAPLASLSLPQAGYLEQRVSLLSSFRSHSEKRKGAQGQPKRGGGKPEFN